MDEQGKPAERERRDWIIILIILLFGFLCVIIAGESAVRFAPRWKLDTSMQSNLDPDSSFLTSRPADLFEPLDPSILTQQVRINNLLTPGALFEILTSIQVTNTPAPSSTPAPTLPASPTALNPTDTPTATNTPPFFPPPSSTKTSTPRPPFTNTPLPSTVPVDLQITKTDGSSTYIAGSNVTYTILVTNNGLNGVNGATLNDLKPAEVTTWGWCINPCTPAANTSANLSATLNLASGASVTYRVLANTSAGATNNLVNTASISAPGGYTDTVPGNNSATYTHTLITPADLSITKTDGGLTTVNTGDTIIYTVRVTNGGPNSVTGAILSDPAVAGLSKTVVACSPVPGQCVTPPTVGQLEGGAFPLPALGNGQFYEIAITTSVTASSGSIVNTASVSVPSSVTDPNTSNNSATDTNTVALVADLRITKTDNSTDYMPNTLKTYTITVFNDGPSDVTGAVVSDIFSTNANINPLVVWTCSSSNGGSCSTFAGIGDINNTVNLPSGSSITYTAFAFVVASPSGPLINTATVAAPSGVTDPDTTNNSATDTDTLLVSSGTTYGNIGPGQDGLIATLPAGGTPVILTLSSSITVNGSHAGPDLVYFEEANSNGIAMDWIMLEAGDGSNWYTILNWGDGSNNPGTSITLPIPVPPNPSGCNSEPDDCTIDVSLLYPYPTLPATGVTIDLDAFSPSIIPNGTVISYIRITVPPGGTDGGVGLDGIYVIP